MMILDLMWLDNNADRYVVRNDGHHLIPHHDDQPDDNALLLRSDVIRNNSPGGLRLLFIFDHVVVDGTTYELFLHLDFF